MSNEAGSTKAKKPTTGMTKRHDGLNSTTTFRSTLEILINSAKTLAYDQNVDRILERFDKTADLEADIKVKEERIKALDTELEKRLADHEITHQQSLLTYEASRDRLKSQVESSETKVVSLRGEIEQRDATLETLKSENASLTNAIHNLGESVKVQDENAKTTGIEIRTLQESLQQSEGANEKLKTGLRQQETKLSQLEGAHKRLQSEYEKLIGQHRSTAQQLNDLQSLTVNLSNEDPEPT